MLLMATAQLAVLAPLVAGAPPNPIELSPEVLGSVLALGALGTGIAFVLSLRNIRVIGGSTASMVTYLIPIVAVVAGVVVLDEQITWYQPVGAVVVLLGVALSQGRFRRRNRGTTAETGSAPTRSGAGGAPVAVPTRR
jgi:drug/metabolite transporter (DMT)-like permease